MLVQLLPTVFVIQVALGEQKLISSHSFSNDQLTNIQFHNKDIYVAGRGQIYKLDKDLNILDKAVTCDVKTDVCDNVNKIMLVNDATEELIVCGTGNDGKCEMRNLSNINTVTHAGSNTLKVSTDEKRPAHAFIMPDGNLMIGVTFGSGLEEITSSVVSKGISYKYAISTRCLSDGTFSQEKWLELDIRESDGERSNPLEMHVALLEDYKIYFKGGFQHNVFSYFTTIQKNFVGDNIYISKLIRICQNDTSNIYNSYADIPISCHKDGLVYNLLQYVGIVDQLNGTLFIATFSAGDNPESTSGDSVICVTKLTDLDQAIMAAKKHFFFWPRSHRSDIERYLPNLSNPLPSSRIRDADFKCDSTFPLIGYVIGETAFNMTAVYTLASDITTLYGGVVDEDMVVIHAGTSAGHIIKFNFLGVGEGLELYENQYVPPGFPIRGIREMNDNIFVLTEKKILKYSNTNCSEYTTCADTMKGRNPVCGWCVYKQSGTRKAACSSEENHWLSSHQSCVSISLDTMGKPVNAGDKQIKMTVVNCPLKQDGDEYRCKYKNGAAIINTESALRDVTRITCNSPTFASHTDATLELWVNDVLLASASFLFYRCGHYNICGECTSTVGSDCQWCLHNIKCVSPGQCNPSEIGDVTKKNQCPQLEDNGLRFLPNKIETEMSFLVQNIPTTAPLDFYLTLPAIPKFQPVTATHTESPVSFKLQVIDGLNSRYMDYPVIIKYGIQGQAADTIVVLDDHFNHKIRIYNCEKLAIDCGSCKALNRMRYSCNWCQGDPALCHYNGSECTPTSTCPAPVVTKIIPRDGPSQGYTRVTIYGSEFGSSLPDISSVTLAGVSCSNIKVVEDEDNPEFTKAVTKQIVCTSGRQNTKLVGVPGEVIVTVAGKQSSKSDGIAFIYQNVSITELCPNKGPIAGGTRITVDGENLGVGNRELTVLFDDTPLLNVQVLPKIDLDAISTSVDFTVQGVVPSGLKNTVTQVAIFLSENVFVAKESLNYTLLPNPKFDSIQAKKGFLSGGTLITLTGKRFDNANLATVNVSYAGIHTAETCTIASSTKTVCAIPMAPGNVVSKYQHTELHAIAKLDGIEAAFMLAYMDNPTFTTFKNDENDNVIEFNSSGLAIRGEKLNLVATISEFTVTVGIDNCTVTELTDTKLVCIPPTEQPQPGIPGAEYPEVNVTVGNIRKTVGFLKYPQEISAKDMVVIIGVVVSVLIVLVVFGIVAGCLVYRKMGKKVKELETIYKDLKLSSIEDRLQESEARNKECVSLSGNVDNPYACITEVDFHYPFHDNDNGSSSSMYLDFDDATRTSSFTESVSPDSGYIHPQAESRSSNQGQPDDDTRVYNSRHPQSEIRNTGCGQLHIRPPTYLELQNVQRTSSLYEELDAPENTR